MMYTVARFRVDASAMDRMLEIKATMDSLRGEGFIEPRRRGDGFVCTVCNDGLWPVHERAIADFVTEFAGAIQQARDAGGAVTIDLAIDEEDRQSAVAYVCVSLAPSLLLMLGSAGVRFEVTSY